MYAHWLAADHDPAALASLDGIATDALAALGEAVPAAVETAGEINGPPKDLFACLRVIY